MNKNIYLPNYQRPVISKGTQLNLKVSVTPYKTNLVSLSMKKAN